MPLQQFQPMPLGRSRDPFCHPEWLFEIKWDGFRSLAYVRKGSCRLISRNDNQFKSFPTLADALPAGIRDDGRKRRRYSGTSKIR
jgi:bifunctional non-homologous end joining protein LigD